MRRELQCGLTQVTPDARGQRWLRHRVMTKRPRHHRKYLDMPFPAVNPALAQALAEREYAEPTPVQSAVLAPEAEGRDLLVSAQTGSGKTVAFGLALAPTLLGDGRAVRLPGAPLALVIAPTRELAMQVKARAELAVRPHRRADRVLRGRHGQPGGAARAGGRRPTSSSARPGGSATIWSARGSISARSARPCWTRPTRCSTSGSARTSNSCSTPRRRRGGRCCSRPRSRKRSRHSPDATSARRAHRRRRRADEPHGDIEYRAVTVAPHDVGARRRQRSALLRGPRRARVLRHARGGAAAAWAARWSAASTRWRSPASSASTSAPARCKRCGTGVRGCCVATDVAARGLDLPQLGLVIHADLPTNKETMLHRSGRTGRGGTEGRVGAAGAVRAPAPGRAAVRRGRRGRGRGATRPRPS